MIEITNPIFQIIAAFVFGSIIGSFLNVLIWRLPRKEGIGGRSHCPHCSHELNARDLVPLLSFALAGGRCRYCGKKVSPRYPIIEFITGILFAFAAYCFPPLDLITSLIFLKALLVIVFCVVIFVIDLEHYLILNRVVFPGYVIFGALAVLIPILSDEPARIFVYLFCAIGAAIPFWLIWYLSKGKWMGFGDVKFMALMGLILGWPGILVALFLSFILGAIVGVGLIGAGKKHLSSKIPFGTFLSLATVLALFFAPLLWGWYWGLFSI